MSTRDEERMPEFLPDYSYLYRLVASDDPEEFQTQVQAALDDGFVPLSRLRLDHTDNFVREFYKRTDAPSGPGPGKKAK